MLGLINKSIQCFLTSSYGDAVWQRIATRIDIGPDGFETMLHYDDVLTDRLIEAAGVVLDRPEDALLEDVGTFLASREALRRLLRFGGSNYWEFLHSLDELPDRARMALPDLELPGLRLSEHREGRFELRVTSQRSDWVAVLAGLLRAMADDYGALALIEPDETVRGGRLTITLLDITFAEGRGFDLAAGQHTFGAQLGGGHEF